METFDELPEDRQRDAQWQVVPVHKNDYHKSNDAIFQEAKADPIGTLERGGDAIEQAQGSYRRVLYNRLAAATKVAAEFQYDNKKWLAFVSHKFWENWTKRPRKVTDQHKALRYALMYMFRATDGAQSPTYNRAAKYDVALSYLRERGVLPEQIEAALEEFGIEELNKRAANERDKENGNKRFAKELSREGGLYYEIGDSGVSRSTGGDVGDNDDDEYADIENFEDLADLDDGVEGDEDDDLGDDGFDDPPDFREGPDSSRHLMLEMKPNALRAFLALKGRHKIYVQRLKSDEPWLRFKVIKTRRMPK